MNDLIERLREEAVISDRPGQMDRLNALADEFAAALEAARAERDALRKALELILENEASDWKAAEEFGGYVLDDELREEARAALRAMGYEVPARD